MGSVVPAYDFARWSLVDGAQIKAISALTSKLTELRAFEVRRHRPLAVLIFDGPFPKLLAAPAVAQTGHVISTFFTV